MTLTIDGAGRIVIPKPMRERFGLRAGSTLEVVETAEGVTLKPAERESPLAMVNGHLVITAKLPPGFDIVKAIAEEREERDRRNLGY